MHSTQLQEWLQQHDWSTVYCVQPGEVETREWSFTKSYQHSSSLLWTVVQTESSGRKHDVIPNQRWVENSVGGKESLGLSQNIFLGKNVVSVRNWRHWTKEFSDKSFSDFLYNCLPLDCCVLATKILSWLYHGHDEFIFWWSWTLNTGGSEKHCLHVRNDSSVPV